MAGGMAGGADGDDLDVVRLDGGAESEGADAAEAVDTDFDHEHILQNKNLQKLVGEFSLSDPFERLNCNI